MQVQIGNSNAVDASSGEQVLLDGNRVTTVVIPDSYTLLEAVATITAGDGVWANHATADSTPDWVESDNEALQALLASTLGCPAGRPKSWKESAK